MSLKIITRSVGDVTILDCRGNNTLGDGAGTLRETIRGLLANGRKKIILNCSEIRYQDSAGNGELVGAWTTTTNLGGALVVLSPNKKLRDLFQISSLAKIFYIFDDEASAIQYFEDSLLQSQCPVCFTRSSPPFLGTPPWPTQSCTKPGCKATFSIAPSNQNLKEGVIQSLRLPTYPDEYLEVTTGAPLQVALVGRLNLFTSNFLNKLWLSLPSRIALLDLSRATEITPEGRDALLRIINTPRQDEGLSVVLEGSTPEIGELLSATPHVYGARAQALVALTELAGKTKPWPATFDLPISFPP